MASRLIVSGISSVQATTGIAESLSEVEYNRQRYSPRTEDDFYLPLSDILHFLQQHSGDTAGDLLDYGCGGSPYRNLFGATNYLRADYLHSPGVDCVINEAGELPLPDESCDVVLSTQVLEHVFSPQVYLSQALRVLRPGGRLLLTTNGIWEDHGCPYDFWRWTADGIRREMEIAGFNVKRVCKLTTGPRAVLFLLQQFPYQITASRRRLTGQALWLLNRWFFRNRPAVNRWLDKRYAQHQVVDDAVDGHRLYIGLGVVAVKKQPN